MEGGQPSVGVKENIIDYKLGKCFLMLLFLTVYDTMSSLKMGKASMPAI